MFRKKHSLMTTVVCILAAGFLATSLTSYFVSRSSLRSEITFSSLPLTSDNIYSEIQRDLLQPVFISSLMAHDTFVRDWVLRGETDEKAIAHYLREIQEKYHTVSCFFVSDTTENYYHTGGILKKVDPNEARDTWYYRVRKMDADYEINIDPDLANRDTLTIFINYKVFDYGHRFIGATGVGLTVNAVKNLINQYQEKYKRNIFFVDRNGAITLRSAANHGEASTIFGMEGIRDYAKDILASHRDTYSYMRDGRHYYLNTRFIKEFNWFLFVEEDEDSPARLLVRTLIINVIFSLIVTCFIFFLIRFQIQAYQRRIETLASTDKLTGLHNRQAFDLLVEQSLKEKKRTHDELSLIMIDLDHFKEINDTFGHLNGDQVLVQAAERLKSRIRDEDALCRWGGEEFLILLKKCRPDDAAEIAESIRHAFENAAFTLSTDTVPLTISLGITQIRDDEDYEIAVARADRALYEAKKSGRNRTEKG